MDGSSSVGIFRVRKRNQACSTPPATFDGVCNFTGCDRLVLAFTQFDLIGELVSMITWLTLKNSGVTLVIGSAWFMCLRRCQLLVLSTMGNLLGEWGCEGISEPVLTVHRTDPD